jgi:hypothetical protein
MQCWIFSGFQAKFVSLIYHNPHKSLSAPKESDITIASANLQIDEVSDSVIVQSTWTKIFTICSENFS